MSAHAVAMAIPCAAAGHASRLQHAMHDGWWWGALNTRRGHGNPTSNRRCSNGVSGRSFLAESCCPGACCGICSGCCSPRVVACWSRLRLGAISCTEPVSCCPAVTVSELLPKLSPIQALPKPPEQPP